MRQSLSFLKDFECAPFYFYIQLMQFVDVPVHQEYRLITLYVLGSVNSCLTLKKAIFVNYFY